MSKSTLSLISAMGIDRSIGIDGELPWKIPEDLQFFKKMTLGKPVIMGRKTAVSLRRALPNRENLVLTSSEQAPYLGMTPVSSIEKILEMKEQKGGDWMVIGGEQIYKAFLPHADSLILTFIEQATPGADAFFPEYDESQWEIVWSESHPESEGKPAFEFRKYQRKK